MRVNPDKQAATPFLANNQKTGQSYARSWRMEHIERAQNKSII